MRQMRFQQQTSLEFRQHFVAVSKFLRISKAKSYEREAIL